MPVALLAATFVALGVFGVLVVTVFSGERGDPVGGPSTTSTDTLTSTSTSTEPPGSAGSAGDSATELLEFFPIIDEQHCSQRSSTGLRFAAEDPAECEPGKYALAWNYTDRPFAGSANAVDYDTLIQWWSEPLSVP